MIWIDYEESKDLVVNDRLKLNQRINELFTPEGYCTNFCVRPEDIVIFKRSLGFSEDKKEHLFVVILEEDIYNEEHNRPCYGEFILNNYEVEKLNTVD